MNIYRRVSKIKATDVDEGPSGENTLLRDNPDVVLFTTASHQGLWLANIIDATFWLTKILQSERNGNQKPTHVTILLLPVGSYQQNPLIYWPAQLIKKMLIGLPPVIKNRLSDNLKSKPFFVQNQSFYNQIYSGKKVHLNYGQDSLTFGLFNTLSLR